MSFVPRFGILALGGLLLAGGCVERKEHLTVEPDGTVGMVLQFAADSYEELFIGDAVPRIEGGWLAVENVVEEDDGKKTYTLEAKATFGPEEPLPSDYASRIDPYPDIVLQFPTSLFIEERRDGIYYHFHRVYEMRPWAPIEGSREQLEEQLEPLKGRSFEDMSIQERAQILQALTEFETARLRRLARLAFLDVSPDAAQDHWLAVNMAISDSLEDVDHEHLAMLALEAQQAEDPAGEAEAALQAEMMRLEDKAMEHIKAAMRESGWFTVSRYNEFLTRLDRHRQYHEVTSELGDDSFEINVTMPGEIVGHNGSSKSGNTVTWEFTGKAVRDRSLELMVSSRRR